MSSLSMQLLPSFISPPNDVHLRYEELSTDLMWNGYQADTNRMRNMENECAHHKYISSESFIVQMQKLLNKMRNDLSNISKYEEEIELMHSGIGVGFCQQCALYVTSNMMKLISLNQKGNVTIYNKSPANSDKSYTKLLLEFNTTEEEGMIIMENYFLNCLQYPGFAKFIFHQSNLWIHSFNVLNLSMKYLNQFCELDKGIQAIIYLKAIANPFQQTAIYLFQIIRNLALFNNNHWRDLLANNGYIYFEVWLNFVEKQLDFGLHLHYKFGMEMMHCFVILITMGLKNMKNDWCRNWRQDFGIKHMKKWLKKIEKRFGDQINGNTRYSHYYQTTKDGRRIIESLIALRNDEDADKMYDAVWNLGKKVWDKKWMSMKCQNIGCTARRLDGKLYKCRKCKCVRFCSRYCQKVDWNRNGHKLYCKKLRKMTKQRKYR